MLAIKSWSRSTEVITFNGYIDEWWCWGRLMRSGKHLRVITSLKTSQGTGFVTVNILSCFFVLKTVIGTIIRTNDRSVLSAETALVRIMWTKGYTCWEESCAGFRLCSVFSIRLPAKLMKYFRNQPPVTVCGHLQLFWNITQIVSLPSRSLVLYPIKWLLHLCVPPASVFTLSPQPLLLLLSLNLSPLLPFSLGYH